MVVVNFIVGLLIVATIIGTLYGLGIWDLKRTGDYDRNTDFIEILIRGILILALIAICVLVLLLIYALGKSVVNELFK